MTRLFLSVSVLSLITACSSSGGGGGGTPVFKVDTGFVNVVPEVSKDKDGKLQVDGYTVPDDDFDVKVNILENSLVDGSELVYDLEVSVDGEVDEDIEVRQIGYTNIGSIFAVGWDGADDPFAAAHLTDIFLNEYPDSWNALDFDAHLNGVEYSYMILDKDTETIYFITDQDGSLLYNNGRLTGNLGDVSVTGQANGEQFDGSSTLTWQGQEYPGDMQSLAVTENVNADPELISTGAFVSSDDTDQTLYSGGWYFEGFEKK